LRKREEGTGGLGFLDTNGKLIREIVIDAHPESFRLEEKGTRIFVNVPDKQEIEVVDLTKTRSWRAGPLQPRRTISRCRWTKLIIG
jgi:hypothetical protein